jgi:hypothetical protein
MFFLFSSQRIKAYLERFPQYSQKDLAYLSTKAYGNANLNPLAHMHAVKMSFEQASTSNETNVNFLSNKEVPNVCVSPHTLRALSLITIASLLLHPPIVCSWRRFCALLIVRRYRMVLQD